MSRNVDSVLAKLKTQRFWHYDATYPCPIFCAKFPWSSNGTSAWDSNLSYSTTERGERTVWDSCRLIWEASIRKEARPPKKADRCLVLSTVLTPCFPHLTPRIYSTGEMRKAMIYTQSCVLCFLRYNTFLSMWVSALKLRDIERQGTSCVWSEGEESGQNVHQAYTPWNEGSWCHPFVELEEAYRPWCMDLI